MTALLKFNGIIQFRIVAKNSILIVINTHLLWPRGTTARAVIYRMIHYICAGLQNVMANPKFKKKVSINLDPKMGEV